MGLCSFTYLLVVRSAMSRGLEWDWYCNFRRCDSGCELCLQQARRALGCSTHRSLLSGGAVEPGAETSGKIARRNEEGYLLPAETDRITLLFSQTESTK